MKLLAPEGRTTRPILQLLKKRLFDILGQTCRDLFVWDLFAGSGSIGIEALSRGAKVCVFVEKDATALAALRGNLERGRFGSRAIVETGDVFADVARKHCPGPDLVFLDPPFPIVETRPELLLEFIERSVLPALSPDGRFVLRVPIGTLFSPPPEWAARADRRDHGESSLIVVSKI